MMNTDPMPHSAGRTGLASEEREAAKSGGRMKTETPLSMLALLALLTVLTFELMRSGGPLFTLAFEEGVTVAAGSAIAAYMGGGLFVFLLLMVTRGPDATSAVPIGVVLLAIARLVVQGLEGWARFGMGLVAIAVAVGVLTLAVGAVTGYRRGGAMAAGALASGAAAAVGIQLALGTWDAYWRHGPVGWGVTGALVASMIGCAFVVRRNAAPSSPANARHIWVLGPALALTVMMLANAGFASAQSDLQLAVAGPIAAAGLLVAGALAPSAARFESGAAARYPQDLVLVMLLAAFVAGTLWASGPTALAFLVAAQVALVSILARLLQPGEHRRPDVARSPGRLAGAASVVGLCAILPLLLFQLDYDVPLGFPNELVIVAAAVSLGAALVPSGRGGSALNRRVISNRPGPSASKPLLKVLLLAAAVVLAGTAIVVTRTVRTDPAPAGPRPAGPINLVSWNLHFGVDLDGDVNLERIATSIEEQDPAVVALQEVSRGWLMGGGTDMVTWLGQRLEMRVVFAPAADRRFGNAILTDLELENVTTLELPYGQGPQDRSAISGDIIVEGGPVRVTSIHLQSKDTTPTRLAQIEAVLAAEGDATPGIITGDFNAEPTWPEISRMIGAGLVSAQDVAGDPSELDTPSTDPEKRIIWIFGQGVTFADARVLSEAVASDHLPIVVTFIPTARGT